MNKKKNNKQGDEIEKEIPKDESCECSDCECSGKESEDVGLEDTGFTKITDVMNENFRRATSEATEFKDKYYRSLAELENTRKRLQSEKSDAISYAVDNTLLEFLGPLDNLERALSFTDDLSDELKGWAQGFKMIAAQFRDILESNDVVEYISVGKKFDPHLHEAVDVVETNDVAKDVIVEEVVKGYRRGKKILRVASVKVATPRISAEGCE